MNPNTRDMSNIFLDGTSDDAIVKIKASITKGYNINQADVYGQTLLHVAAAKGCLAICRYLVEEAHADVNRVDANRQTPLHLAAAQGFLAVCRYLVKRARADVNKKVDANRQTPLHVAAAKGRLAICRYLVETAHADVNQADANEKTPLHLAATQGCLAICRYLVEEAHADVNQVDANRQTPLHVAAAKGRLAICRYLVEEAHADVNQVHTNRQTPLHVAAAKGRLAICQYLVEEAHADVNQVDTNGQTFLHLALQSDHLHIWKHFFVTGSDVNQTDLYGKKPLHVAAAQGDLDSCQKLVEQEHADVNQAVKYKSKNTKIGRCRITNGKTPLHFAASRGHYEVCQYLVEKGGDVNACSARGTPLHFAASRGHYEVCQYLVEKGAHVEIRSSVERFRGTGFASLVQWDPLHLAAAHGHYKICRYLVEQKAGVNRLARSGKTPLYFASVKGHLAICQYFVEEAHADVNVTAVHSRRRPLHAAAYRGHREICRYLIEHGADLNKKAGYGQTALDIAISEDHLTICEYLVEKGASIEHGALDIAAKNGYYDICRLLLAYGVSVIPEDQSYTRKINNLLKSVTELDAEITQIDNPTSFITFVRAHQNNHLVFNRALSIISGHKKVHGLLNNKPWTPDFQEKLSKFVDWLCEHPERVKATENALSEAEIWNAFKQYLAECSRGFNILNASGLDTRGLFAFLEGTAKDVTTQNGLNPFPLPREIITTIGQLLKKEPLAPAYHLHCAKQKAGERMTCHDNLEDSSRSTLGV